MSRLRPIIAATALALTGCGSGAGNNSANGTTTSRTENGQLTARVQGVDLKVNLPPPLRRMTEADDYLYPGAHTLRGGPGQRFHSDASTETVAGWYQDPARHNRFSIDDSTQNDDSWLLTATARGGDTFSVRLTPGGRGGTDGTITVTPAADGRTAR